MGLPHQLTVTPVGHTSRDADQVGMDQVCMVLAPVPIHVVQNLMDLALGLMHIDRATVVQDPIVLAQDSIDMAQDQSVTKQLSSVHLRKGPQALSLVDLLHSCDLE